MTFTPGQTSFVEAFYDGVAMTTQLNLVNSAPWTVNNPRAQPNTQNVIGSYGGGNFLTGVIYEIVAYNNKLPLAQQQEVEAYLAYKWGFASTLPANNPYLGGNPTCLTAYVDGAQKGVTAFTQQPFFPAPPAAAAALTLRVGWNGQTSSNGGDLFAGSVYDLRVYSRALTAAQVAALAAPPLVAWPNAVVAPATAAPGVTSYTWTCNPGYIGVLSVVQNPQTNAWVTTNTWNAPAGSTSLACAACAPGTFAAAGATAYSCLVCPAGYFGASTALTTATCTGPCSAGAYCPAGSAANTPNTCPAGSYCVAGAAPAPCSAGYYGATLGLSIATCTGACSAGAACPAGSTANTPNTCPAGSFCAAGAAPAPCSAGYYGATLGLSVATCTAPCAGGANCPAGSTASVAGSCPAGKYCAPGAAPASCAPGTYSLAGASACTNCPAGTFGATSGLATAACSGPCAAGTYSPAGQTACIPCSAGAGCPVGSTANTAGSCPIGSYCPAGTAPTPCPGGSYGSTAGLASSACTGLCSAGASCPPGSTANSANTCPIGSYCPAGTAPTPCPGGSYGSTMGLSSAACTGLCSAGASCPPGSTANLAGSCAIGSFCAAGAAPKLCPAGTFGSSAGLSTPSCSGSCSAGVGCPAGSTANVAGSCPAGSFCAAGAGPVACLSGTYSNGGATACTGQVCAVGSAGTVGATFVNYCTICATGYALGGSGGCSSCPASALLNSPSQGCAPLNAAGARDPGVAFALSGSQAEGIAAFASVTSPAGATFVPGPFGVAASALSLASGTTLASGSYAAATSTFLPTLASGTAATLTTGSGSAASIAGWVQCAPPTAAIAQASVLEWGAAGNSSSTAKMGLLVTGAGNTANLFAPTGAIASIFAGSAAGAAGSANNAAATSATFSAPGAVAVDLGFNVYVADTANNLVRVAAALGGVSTLAGSGAAGAADGTGAGATFNAPSGLAINLVGGLLYVADTGSNKIRQIVIATGATSTIAGGSTTNGAAAGATDGTGLAALFSGPAGLAISPNYATLFVSDTGNNKVRAIVIATGATTTLAGGSTAGGTTSGSADGTGMAALFLAPRGLAADANGFVFVADSGNNRVRRIAAATGVVTTLAGGSATLIAAGSADGVGTAALFSAPYGVAVDAGASPQVYVVDSANNAVRKVNSATARVSTLVTAAAGGLTAPKGLALDVLGNLWLADTGHNRVAQGLQLLWGSSAPGAPAALPALPACDGAGFHHVAVTTSPLSAAPNPGCFNPALVPGIMLWLDSADLSTMASTA